MRHSLEMPSPQLPRYLRRNHGSLYVADSDHRDDDDDDSDHRDSDNDTYDVQMIVMMTTVV